jgi:signal transduction histidine kinase
VFKTHQRPVRDEAGDVIGTAALSIDVTAQRADDVRLRDTIGRLRALRSRLDTIREEEGTRIAREIHDNVGQTLTAVRMDVAHVRRQLAASSPSLVEADARLRSMADVLDLAVEDLRRVATDLRPHILDDLGIIAAIEWQLSDFEHRTGVPCVFASDVGSIDMPAVHATAVYRIIQEALTNIMRHAAATRVDVRVWIAGADAHISIRDDGKGMDPAAAMSLGSLGLLGMQERAAMFAGDVRVTSDGAGHGTTVSMCIPLR